MPSDWRPSCETVTVHADGVVVCEVAGDLDCATVTILRHATSALLEFPAAVLDLRRVGFIDSAALSVVIGAVRKALAGEVRLAIATGRDHTSRLFHTVGIDRLVPVTVSLDDAKAAVGPAPSDRHEGAIGTSDDRRVSM